MGQKRSSSKSFRKLFIGSFAVLGLSAACGKNPELAINGDRVRGGAGMGEPCDTAKVCASGLLCGPDDVCVGACGDATSRACGPEACLPSGNCSTGLGRTCAGSEDCSEGLVCSALSRCAVSCEPDAPDVCKNGMTCRPTGTCPLPEEIDLPPGGGEGGDSPGAGGAPGCIDVEVEFTPQIPTVLLLIDRSGSMSDENGFGAAVAAAVADGSYELGDCPKNNDWRWNVVRDVLMSPTKGIIKPLEDRVRFGMSLYSSRNGQIAPAGEGPTPPIVIDTTKMCPELIEVPIGLRNHQAMLDEFKCSDISKDTPTGESLVAAAATLAKFEEPGPKIIVLATDGAPDTCECPNFDGHVPAKCKADGFPAKVQADVVATAKQIRADGVTVHVINVSTPGELALQEHLAAVAEAGGGKVYPGFSPGALTGAFDEIIDGVRSCQIDLKGEIAKGKASSGTIKLDGEVLMLDDPDGWQVNSPSQIELLGAACEAIKSGEHDLDIKFPCDSFKPPVH